MLSPKGGFPGKSIKTPKAEKLTLCKTTKEKRKKRFKKSRALRGRLAKKRRRKARFFHFCRKNGEKENQKRRKCRVNLHRQVYFQEKSARIICAKGAFHFQVIGAIMFTSYRGTAQKGRNPAVTFKTAGVSNRLLRILDLIVQTQRIP